MRASSTRVSHSHIRCRSYRIPYMDVPNRRSWNLDLLCTREPHNMPHGPSSNRSLSHRSCLGICLPFVRQDESGQTTRKDKNLQPRMRLVVLLMSTAIRKPTCGKHWWSCKPWNQLGIVPRVPCIHASRIVYPHKSMVHHTLPSLSSMCHSSIFDLFHRLSFCARGARKHCRGDVSPDDACDKIRTLESLRACFLHMWILEDWRDGKKEPHIAFSDKQERC